MGKNMNNSIVEKEVIDICLELFDIPELDRDTIVFLDFIDDLAMDSIIFMTLIVELETRLNICFSNDMLIETSFRNVKQICKNIDILQGKI